jgi:hypothetical protein
MNAMNRREFLGTSLAAGIYSTGRKRAFPFLDHGSSSQGLTTSRPTPAWLTTEPLVMAGCWDEFPLFQRREGGGPAWFEEMYRQQGTEQTVQALKDVGVTLAIIHFFKGFGLEAEREHIADARALSKLLKQAGMRVGLYVGSTLAYETFLLEKPEAEAWFVPDFLGRPVYYDDQTFRKRVYFMHPGYREYIKKVVQLGIETVHADLIHFDNTSNQGHAPIFQHPMAIQDFRQYLGTKYKPSELKQRFGFSDGKYIVPPKPYREVATIDDPLFQEWTDFRCHQLSSYYAEMSAFIHSIDPAVAVDNNPSSGMAGRNTIWEQGVDYPQLLGDVDIVWTEEGNAATVTAEGILVSKIRTFKMASLLNKRVFCYTYGSTGAWGYEKDGGGPLQMAESMAYNRQCFGMVGGFQDAPQLPSRERHYVRFFHDNFEFYRGVNSVADVAILYSYATMGFNNERPAVSFMLASQMLIQSRLLFDIIFDEQLEDLSRYKVLFLADQECLSDRQMKRIREFVTLGGGLVATEHTSLYTEWRRRRKNFGLADCFGISAPRWNGPEVPETIVAGGPIQKKLGKGKVMYVPEIVPATPKPPGEAMTSEYWSSAVNARALRDAVVWAAGGTVTLETDESLSPSVTMELVHQEREKRLILHILNYDHARHPAIHDVHVEVRIPAPYRVKHLRELSPDRPGEERSLRWTSGPTAKVLIPVVEVYTLLIFDLE